MNEETYNPVRNAIKWWLRISSWVAIIIVWFLVQPDEPDEDSTEAEPAGRLKTNLLVTLGRIAYAVISVVIVFCAFITISQTVRVVFQLDYGHPWLNWPWWIVLPLWLLIPFVYYFYALGLNSIVPLLKKK